jgi:hypothetical protein
MYSKRIKDSMDARLGMPEDLKEQNSDWWFEV